eukprot:3115283-Pleurochrysis_carterae.AAC.3
MHTAATVALIMLPPFQDSVHYLAREVWPLIREKLPNAHVKIFGSHMTPDIKALQDRCVCFARGRATCK